MTDRADVIVVGASLVAPALCLSLARVGGDIDARLNRQHHARLERAPLAIKLVVPDVVHVEAQPVARGVHIELAVALLSHHLVERSAQQTQLN